MKLPFNIDLKDKVAVITGAGGVLCGMFAQAIAQCDAKVALLDINEDAAKAMAKRITVAGGIAQGFQCNVLERESLDVCRDRVMAAFGSCDILINGAGGNNPKATTDMEYYQPEKLSENTKSFFNLDVTGVDFVFRLNFLGTLLPTQVFASDMVDKPSAVILNISSMNAFIPLTKIPAYSGAKAAVSNTKWLAVHFSKTRIRVNAIAPGFFVTAQNKALLYDDAGNPTARTEKILAATPMGRFGELEELIGTVLWLLDDRASGFVTGIVVPVDGGFSAYSGV
jgi:NAD(P)-dependent dehydrogenase (short-subunit alcohol dehydrogenase family)